MSVSSLSSVYQQTQRLQIDSVLLWSHVLDSRQVLSNASVPANNKSCVGTWRGAGVVIRDQSHVLTTITTTSPDARHPTGWHFFSGGYSQDVTSERYVCMCVWCLYISLSSFSSLLSILIPHDFPSELSSFLSPNPILNQLSILFLFQSLPSSVVIICSRSQLLSAIALVSLGENFLSACWPFFP